ncbi:uncharacterized protein A1O5_02129 [Cladophialophora psammophila CBS 110553]|uniref:Uncharacterized protein n=1 Tax=Cladophialophora psammophila CBS 110553 TaxID=1182543 RepID=W9X5G4_9EURO|nr:uncharacterized protein A1O5_02129 [Cladophialophora psammophila CBS 110553]EXJ75433.1 hypothetical protein A1O5_02129 [Cladophialophora psammophila CBS 110553]
MSHLKYYNYPGFGEKMADIYSQAVRVGNRVECAGQGGWDPATGIVSETSTQLDQIEQAFKNVDMNLKQAGAERGWGQVFRVNSYHIPLNDEIIEKVKTEIAKWCGKEHRPIWTAVEVPKLGLENMKVEIEVSAHVGD